MNNKYRCLRCNDNTAILHGQHKNRQRYFCRPCCFSFSDDRDVVILHIIAMTLIKAGASMDHISHAMSVHSKVARHWMDKYKYVR